MALQVLWMIQDISGQTSVISTPSHASNLRGVFRKQEHFKGGGVQ